MVMPSGIKLSFNWYEEGTEIARLCHEPVHFLPAVGQWLVVSLSTGPDSQRKLVRGRVGGIDLTYNADVADGETCWRARARVTLLPLARRHKGDVLTVGEGDKHCWRY